MADYNILLASDANYMRYVFTTCQSIIDSLHYRPDNAQDKLIFHIIVSTEQDQQLAQNYSASFTKFNAPLSKVGFAFNFYQIDDSKFYQYTEMYREGKRTVGNYFRLMLGSVLPQSLDRVLYLDCDLLIYQDIRLMFQSYPMGKEVLYAVTTHVSFFLSKDITSTSQYKLPALFDGIAPLAIPFNTYFNSGVLLINLNEWRKQNIEKKLWQVACSWEMPLHDQDMLNAALMGKVAFMDWSWNISFSMYALFLRGGLRLNNGQEVLIEDLPLTIGMPEPYDLALKVDHPCIVHFTEDKPWAKDFLQELKKSCDNDFEMWFRHQKHWFDIDGKVEFYLEKYKAHSSETSNV